MINVPSQELHVISEFSGEWYCTNFLKSRGEDWVKKARKHMLIYATKLLLIFPEKKRKTYQY